LGRSAGLEETGGAWSLGGGGGSGQNRREELNWNKGITKGGNNKISMVEDRSEVSEKDQR